MDYLEHFKTTYELEDKDVIIVPYGSRVYGTAGSNSDFDYIAITPPNSKHDTGAEYRKSNINITLYNRRHFQDQLNIHKIHALEAYFHPSKVCKDFKFKLNLYKLRVSISEKSQHSFVKAKKKMEVERDYYIGWKSLFHSLRILMFGTQVAKHGKIVNYGEANNFWFEILNSNEYNWEYFNNKYKPIYNQLATEFRKVAPKGNG